MIFGSGITRDNLSWNFDGNNLIFTLTDSPNDSLTILNHTDSNYVIENIEIDGSQLTSKITSDNNPPVLVSPIGTQTVAEDSEFNLAIAENFQDNDLENVLTYTATLADGSKLPSWLSFDPTTRTFSGTPLNEDVGTLSVLVTATDDAGATKSDTFDLEVTNVDEPNSSNSIAIMQTPQGFQSGLRLVTPTFYFRLENISRQNVS